MDGGGPAGSPFDRAIDLVLELEGAPTNDPVDPGGETHFGIAHVYHPGIPWPPTREQAIQIYRHDYWSPIHGDELPPGLALVVFDAAVIPGLGFAIRALQQALRVEDDGVVGPNTLAAARYASWRTVLAVTAARLAEFERQVRTYPFKTRWAAGWRNRALSTYREAVRLEART
jgi:lysozyme family protein